MNYNLRLEKLQAIIKEISCDAMIIENKTNIYYMTGLYLSAGILLVHTFGAHLIVDNRYLELAQKHSPFTVLSAENYPIGELLQSTNFSFIQTIAFDSEHTSFKRFQELEKYGTLIPIANPVQALRILKDTEEQEKLRKSAQLGSEGFDYTCTLLKDGISEEEIALELEIFWKRKGSRGVAFDPIIAFGANSSMPHHRASKAKLTKGMPVLIDIGVNLDHYHSDMTRVVFYGEPDPKIQEIYTIVQKAQQAAINSCKPGILIGELDSIARNIIAEHGYESNFTHSLGHGIGLEVHEVPFLRNKPPFKEISLEAGMVLTIEPGIYVAHLGGVRIEDTVLITEQGHENLTNRSTQPLFIS